MNLKMKLTVGYSTRKIDNNYIDSIKRTIGLKENEYEIIPLENNGLYSLSEAYNIILDKSKSDIVVLMHDDIKIEPNWGKKLIVHFNKGTHDIIGVAGTTNFPKSGMWWENKESMIGIVKHSKDGKTWVNRYSESQGYDIKTVVIVDGLFIAFDKTKIKHKFDEEFKGFHFYDIAFCFPNYLDGINIGVITDIKITHLSIGQTNQEWEENRKQFVEKYNNQLIKTQKLKVLIGCLSFSNLTGSELYVFELAKELIKQNCEVTICSNIGNPLGDIAKSLGIKLSSINEPPGFKIGDGKFSLNTPNGVVLSLPNVIYKIDDVKFDIIHLNHKPVTKHLLKFYPNTPVVCTIHSEVIDLEEPIISEQIKKYIAIRPEIKEHLIKNHNISEDKIDVIYNPIDYNRFNNIDNKISDRKNKRIIFVGTIDYLRKNTILDLIKTTRDNNNELWIVGRENGVTINNIKIEDGGDFNHVKYYQATSNVENLVKECDETAGILLGRTTIEGWLCGKSGWIYDIDRKGNILSKSLNEPPNDVDKFRSDIITKQIIEKYKEIIK
jgi:glycosyltransferase involved in cell wall biosynthesis